MLPHLRQANVVRQTNETQIEAFIALDCAPGSGTAQRIDVSTGIGFLDHVSIRPLQLPVCFCIVMGTDVYRTSETRRHVLDYEM
jgi:hypothetical protein